MLTSASIIIRLPSVVSDEYYGDRFNGIINYDLKGAFLQFWINPSDYNAANPTVFETKIGYSTPYTIITQDLYKLEVVENDARSHIKTEVLKSLLNNPEGNLSVYGYSQSMNSCEPNLVVLEDYHELDESSDIQRGYTLRIGILQFETLKGAFRNCNEVTIGNSYLLTPSESSLVSGNVLDGLEWDRYTVLSRYLDYMDYDSLWNPNESYSRGDRVAAIAPPDLYITTKNYTKGIRLTLTQTHKVANGSLDSYL